MFILRVVNVRHPIRSPSSASIDFVPTPAWVDGIIYLQPPFTCLLFLFCFLFRFFTCSKIVVGAVHVVKKKGGGGVYGTTFIIRRVYGRIYGIDLKKEMVVLENSPWRLVKRKRLRYEVRRKEHWIPCYVRG